MCALSARCQLLMHCRWWQEKFRLLIEAYTVLRIGHTDPECCLWFSLLSTSQKKNEVKQESRLAVLVESCEANEAGKS